VVPRVALPNGADLDATFDRPRLGDRADATAWLAAAGRADPGARRLRIGIDVVEAARDDVLVDFSLGQLPDHPEEGWAALERPTADDRGRLCLLAAGHRPRFAEGPVQGLVLGGWTEAIPRRRQTAGMAVHFDAPSARAPQAILICSAEPETGFRFDLAVDMVRQTLELARIRMVGPETLAGLGQFLPAIAMHPDIVPGEAAT